MSPKPGEEGQPLPEHLRDVIIPAPKETVPFSMKPLVPRWKLALMRFRGWIEERR